MSYKLFDEYSGYEEIFRTYDEAFDCCRVWALDVETTDEEKERYLLNLAGFDSRDCNDVTRAIQEQNETLYTIRQLDDEIVYEFTQNMFWKTHFPEVEEEFYNGDYDDFLNGVED